MSYYLLFKSLHLISMVAWMAGLFYLPRLFAYHTKATQGSEADELFQTMERKLLRIIMNPAMISTFIFGLALAYIIGFKNLGIWFHIKFTLVLILAGFHGYLAKCRKQFIQGNNQHSFRFFAIINEIPTLLLVAIVFLVVFKYF